MAWVQGFASVLIKLGLLGLDAGTSPATLDLLNGGVTGGGAMNSPSIPNTCIFQVTGIPGTVNPYKQADVSISAWLRCGDKTDLVGSWIGVPTATDLKVSDPRIGDLTLNFQASKFPTYPFPGDLIVRDGYWTDSAFKDGIGMGNCINFSKHSGLIGKDCSGEKVILIACDEGFGDGSSGVINDKNIQERGWLYAMALPVQGVNPGCSDGKRAVEFKG
ncbi:hypothetical protein BCR34DRAFT_564517 [Clohesyomyces aquaticus]|uniref:Uncharacterized protein n=1 Tax=Clohesyomyces aquaticus TaxID=1231657 RepID=A0A1Y1ZNR3_9PLEO|nr:hypothetical protein BCR34DRAFT_564517 [Clohesyomyces aquaticus]